MLLSVDEFRAWSNKSITLLGMSGVGKTYLAGILRQHDWFHYSGDYRIGTRYLDEAILDNIKQQAMQVPFLRDLLRSDHIYIRNNITVDNLGPVLSFIGMPGSPEQGGLPMAVFERRQELYRRAEITAMLDVPEFIRKALEIYGYQHFVNDVGGSLCELDDPQVLRVLEKHTLILYIEVTAAEEAKLIQRAEQDPKPLYFRPDFLNEQIARYSQEKELASVADAAPDDFIRWVFPRLFRARVPRYEAIARQYGYTVTLDEISGIRGDADFIELLEVAIQRRGAAHGVV